MKTKFIFSLVIVLSFIKSEAQIDSLRFPRTLNQVYAGVLGDNYFSTLGSSIGSVNYSRKSANFGLIFFGGIGNPLKIPANQFKSSFTSFTFAAGILFRKNNNSQGLFVYKKRYKRNALWGSISLAMATGGWYFIRFNYSSHPGGAYTSYFFHRIDFNLLPGVSYQFQSKNEKFFCRITGGVKLFSYLFSYKYRDDQNEFAFPLFPWIGISIGGAW